MAEQSPIDLDLRSYLQVLRRRKWIVVFATLIVTGVALATSLSQTKRYRTSATLFVGRSAAADFVDPLKGSTDPFRRIANEIQIVQGEGVRQLVERRLRFTAFIGASGAQGEDVITLTAEDTDPERAAAIANTFAEVYIEYRKTAGTGDTRTVETQLSEQIDRLQAQLDELNAAAAAEDGAGDVSLAARRDPLIAQLSTLRQQLAQLQLGASLDPPAQILSRAGVPGSPFEPKPRQAGVVGLGVGLLVGLGLALLRDYLDDSLKSTNDLTRAAHGLTSLATIPLAPSWREREDAIVLSQTEPASAVAEAYRSLRTSIRFLSVGDDGARVVQFTSPNASEGKSTTVANLGVAFARSGYRVVMVDADLRRPRLASFFQLDTNIGLTSVLLGELSIANALQPVANEGALWLLAAGEPPPNPSELLSSARTVEILDYLKRGADFVLVDTPPVLPVTDAVLVSEHVDATVLVVRAGSTSRKQLSRAHETLRQVNARVSGAVLIGGDEMRAYDYAYGATSPGRRRGPRRTAVSARRR